MLPFFSIYAPAQLPLAQKLFLWSDYLARWACGMWVAARYEAGGVLWTLGFAWDELLFVIFININIYIYLCVCCMCIYIYIHMSYVYIYIYVLFYQWYFCLFRTEGKPMFSITICFLIFLHVKFLPRATGQDLKDEKGHCLSGRQKASIRTCSVHMLFQSIYIYILQNYRYVWFTYTTTRICLNVNDSSI